MLDKKNYQTAKPILFNTEMVRAILNGRKTVTRRCVKPSQLMGIAPDSCKNGLPEEFIKEKPLLFLPYCSMEDDELIGSIYKPPFATGDILYVKETWHKDLRRYMYRADYSDTEKFYRNGNEVQIKWKPSIHMPKDAARIFLEVTSVKAERLQNMDVSDAHKEGINISIHAIADGERLNPCSDFSLEKFESLWNSTIKTELLHTYGWNANPYVWVIEFKVCNDWR